MKASDLITLWAAPDNSRLTAKQYSFRLPIHVAAKLNALCDLYPEKTKTQIVGDLLAAALAEVENTLPREQIRRRVLNPDTGRIVSETTTAYARFRQVAQGHFDALESEAGNPRPKELYEGGWNESEGEK